MFLHRAFHTAFGDAFFAHFWQGRDFRYRALIPDQVLGIPVFPVGSPGEWARRADFFPVNQSLTRFFGARFSVDGARVVALGPFEA